MSVLDQICADKLDHIRSMKQNRTISDLENQIKDTSQPIDFIKQLQDIKSTELIAEVKKASPSKGIIREDFNPVEIAKIYEDSGAACLSVLTDEPYFQGKDQYLEDIRQNVTLPILRKDFMLDPYQIVESRALGADCILLIMAALSDSQAEELYAAASEYGMDSLFEVHDGAELERAMALNPQMVGVNNRNLKTLEVSHQTGLGLAAAIPENVLKVAESGIYTPDDIETFEKAGYEAFLVGESLMREPDISSAVKKLLNKN